MAKKIIFEIKANVSCYDSWERESLVRCFVTVCCACHLWRPPWIIPHGRSRWMWASAQTYKERRRKRNNNKLNCVWTTNVSQVSWIFAMNLKLNRSSLYYWQRDMLIVLIICAVFTEPHLWTILKLCYWGLKIIYDLRTLPGYLKIQRHEFSANRC